MAGAEDLRQDGSETDALSPPQTARPSSLKPRAPTRSAVSCRVRREGRAEAVPRRLAKSSDDDRHLAECPAEFHRLARPDAKYEQARLRRPIVIVSHSLPCQHRQAETGEAAGEVCHPPPVLGSAEGERARIAGGDVGPVIVPVVSEEGVEGGRKRAAADGEAVADPVVGCFVGRLEGMVVHEELHVGWLPGVTSGGLLRYHSPSLWGWRIDLVSGLEPLLRSKALGPLRGEYER